MTKAESRYNERSNVDTAGAHYCYTMHPVKVGKGTVQYVKGDTVTLTDSFTTTQLHLDTVFSVKTITKRLYIHDTLRFTDTVIDNSHLSAKQAEIDGLRSDNIKAWDAASKAKIQAEKRLNWMLFGLLGWLLLIAGVVLKIMRRI